MIGSDELLPCPFCGGAPEKISIGTIACRGLVEGKEIHNTISMHPSKWNNRAAMSQPTVTSDAMVDGIQRRNLEAETHPPGGARELVSAHTIRAVLAALAAQRIET